MTDTEETHISPEMAAAVGAELFRRVSHPVTDSDIRRWAIAVYWPEQPPTRFLAGDGLLIAPEDFNPFAWSVAEASRKAVGPGAGDTGGLEELIGIPGPRLRFMLNGGMEAEYGAPIRSGDVITSANKLAAYRERQGRLGRMLFITTEDTWTNQNGELVKRGRFTMIRY